MFNGRQLQSPMSIDQLARCPFQFARVLCETRVSFASSLQLGDSSVILFVDRRSAEEKYDAKARNCE